MLKSSVRDEVATAKLLVPDLINKAKEQKEKDREKEGFEKQEVLKKAIKDIDEWAETWMGNLAELAKQYPFEPEPQRLINDFKLDHSDSSMEKDLGSKKASLELFQSKWLKTFKKVQSSSIPIYDENVRNLESCKIYQGKIDDTLDRLAPKKSSDEQPSEDLKSILNAVANLRKSIALEEKEFNNEESTEMRKFLAQAMAGLASEAYEILKKFEISVSLPKDPQERKEALDKLVENNRGADSLDSRKDRLEGQIIMRNAIALRFDVEFTTKGIERNPLGSGIKGLGQLYDALGQVPPMALKLKLGPMKLTYVEFVKGKHSTWGEYDSNFDMMILHLPTDGRDTVKIVNGKEETLDDVSQFQSTTFHETGHAVDHETDFMKNNGPKVGFGQWKISDRNEVEGLYVTALTKQYSDQPAELLEAFVSQAVDGKMPARPKNSGEELFPLLKDWDALEDVGKILVKLNEKARFWYNGSAIEAAKFGNGRVFFQANDREWWSYNVSERSGSLTDYQWRAPTEWFAEAYMLHHVGKLSKDHEVAKFCIEKKL